MAYKIIRSDFKIINTDFENGVEYLLNFLDRTMAEYLESKYQTHEKSKMKRF